MTQKLAQHTGTEEAKPQHPLSPATVRAFTQGFILLHTTAKLCPTGTSTHVDGGLVAGQDAAQPLQVTSTLSY